MPEPENSYPHLSKILRQTISLIGKSPLKRDTEYQKRKHFKHRDAINYSKGKIGDCINFMNGYSRFQF